MEPRNDDIPLGRVPKFSRRNFLRVLSAGAAGSFIDARWIEPSQLSVTREAVACRNLPNGLDGLRIAVLSDFHYRDPKFDDRLMSEVVEKVGREKPDLIALVGDFIDSDARMIAPLLERLKPLQAEHGVFAVMGNHDGWNGDRETIRRQFEKSGISFLINCHSSLTIRGEKLAVAGTDFVWKGRPDPERTLKGISAETPVLALVHEPDFFDVMTEHREIALQVSGHTHGGQCRVPWIGYAPVTPKFGSKYVYGSFQRRDSNLFVTRGIGTTGMRLRFACPPELAVLTLRAAVDVMV